MKRSRLGRFVLLVWLGAVLVLAPPGRAYLDAPIEKLTLPELLKEFKSIAVVKAATVDLDRGVVVWSAVEQLRGDPPGGGGGEGAGGKFKHLLKLRGGVPPALRGLKAGQQAVFFSSDGWDRGVVRVDGCWYVVGFENDSGWWRIAYTDRHYDFNVCFAGSADELAAAVRALLKGESVTVPCRVKPQEEPTQTVRYDPKRPKEKTVVAGPATRPAGRKDAVG